MIQDFAVPLRDAEQFCSVLLLSSCENDQPAQFLTEQLVRDKHWKDGLRRRTLNRLLLRDELRRLFSLLDLTMPCRAREGFEELLMQVAGKEDEIPVVIGMWSNA